MGKTMGRMAQREVIFLDTHVVVWLFQGKKVFSEKVRELMTHSDLRISPMVRFELMMLFEKKKIESPLKILTSLKQDFYFREDSIDFGQLITSSMSLNFSRDPFDRMIVAHSKIRACKLISKDRVILEHYHDAIW